MRMHVPRQNLQIRDRNLLFRLSALGLLATLTAHVRQQQPASQRAQRLFAQAAEIMEFKQGLHLGQRLEQRLVMTQQLQQAIKLLQLSRTELLEAVSDALNENPLLEEDVPTDSTLDPPPSALTGGEAAVTDIEAPPSRDERNEIDWQEYFTDLARGPSEGGGSFRDSDDEERPALSQTLTRASTLPEFLDEQLGTTDLAEADKVLVEDIIGNLDDDGYFRPTRLDIVGGTDLVRRQLAKLADQQHIEKIEAKNKLTLYWLTDDEVALWQQEAEQKGCKTEAFYANSLRAMAQAHGVTVADVRRALDAVRTLDPAGVASRDLRECLMTQALARHPKEMRLHKLIELGLPYIEARDHNGLRRDLRLRPNEEQRLMALLASLEPRPGRHFIGETARYITPDVYVYKLGEDYTVVLNEDGMPKLRVSNFYKQALTGDGPQQSGRPARQDTSDAKDYLQEKMRAATWMIRSIHQRQSTIQRVSESIMRFQRPFLDHGVEKLRPLVLREVAEDVGLHESTVSRVTTAKYVHTPQGIFELKFFFGAGVPGGDGSDVASEAVKTAIKRFIDHEQPHSPLSDQEIVEMLHGDWDRGKMLARLSCTENQLEALRPRETMTVARRTVAKYRESLNIPPSSQRRKQF